MSGPSLPGAAARRDYVVKRVGLLEPFEFVVVGLAIAPFDAARIRREPGGALSVDVSGREGGQPFSDDQKAALAGLGFVLVGDNWRADPAPPAPEDAVTLVEKVVDRVFGATDASPVDVRHGSDAAEHEAEEKRRALTERIAPVLTALLGHEPPQDVDGDFVVDLGGSRVFVAPRSVAGRPPVVRVFTITNTGLPPTPELGLYLSRLNFTLMFGRFSIDIANPSVWFDETLLGDHVTDEELRFTVEMVATTASEWAVRIAQTFGGGVPQPPGVAEPAPVATKPGEGGYL